MVLHKSSKMADEHEQIEREGSFGEGIASALIVTNLTPDFFDSTEQKVCG
jgi:hypothetical protein